MMKACLGLCSLATTVPVHCVGGACLWSGKIGMWLCCICCFVSANFP